MIEHFTPLEADFQAHYGLDLKEVLWGPAPLGARHLYSLMTGLPRNTAFGRAMGWEWDNSDEMIALLLESYIRVHSNGKGKPFHIPRPWEQKEEEEEAPKPKSNPTPKEPSSVDDMKKFFRGAIRHDKKKVNHGD